MLKLLINKVISFIKLIKYVALYYIVYRLLLKYEQLNFCKKEINSYRLS